MSLSDYDGTREQIWHATNGPIRRELWKVDKTCEVAASMFRTEIVEIAGGTEGKAAMSVEVLGWKYDDMTRENRG
jgi:hypothetical protein